MIHKMANSDLHTAKEAKKEYDTSVSIYSSFCDSNQDVELQSTIGTKLLEALQKKCINWIDPHTPVHPIEPPEPLPSDSIDDSDNYIQILYSFR